MRRSGRRLRLHVGYLQRIVKLCLIAAQRIGEVAGMVPAELDLKAREWRLPGSRTKNANAHVVPLSDLALEIIKEAAADEGKPQERGVHLEARQWHNLLRYPIAERVATEQQTLAADGVCKRSSASLASPASLFFNGLLPTMVAVGIVGGSPALIVLVSLISLGFLPFADDAGDVLLSPWGCPRALSGNHLGAVVVFTATQVDMNTDLRSGGAATHSVCRSRRSGCLGHNRLFFVGNG